MSDQDLPKVGTGSAEQQGIAIVKEVVNRPVAQGGLGYLLRELPTSDYGIDGQIEVTQLNEAGILVATGRILSIQVKSGASYFANEDDSTWSVYIQKTTVEYWRRHSVPVLLVLVDLTNKRGYWVRGDSADHAETAESFRIRVPKNQVLDHSSVHLLAELAENTTEDQRRMATLEADLPLIVAAVGGAEIVLDIDLWVNKSSGRMDYHLGVRSDTPQPSDPAEMRTFASGSIIGTNGDPLQGASFIAPWATAEPDVEFEENHLDDLYAEYLSRTGTWDNEDQCYIDSTGTFESWRDKRREAEGAPLAYEDSGETVTFRLLLTPNKLASAFLTVRKHLSGQSDDQLPRWEG